MLSFALGALCTFLGLVLVGRATKQVGPNSKVPTKEQVHVVKSSTPPES